MENQVLVSDGAHIDASVTDTPHAVLSQEEAQAASNEADAYQTIGAMTHQQSEKGEPSAPRSKFIGMGKMADKSIQRKVRHYPVVDKTTAGAAGDRNSSPAKSYTGTAGSLVIHRDDSPDEDTEVVDMSEQYGGPTSNFQKRIDSVMGRKDVDDAAKYRMIEEVSKQFAQQNEKDRLEKEQQLGAAEQKDGKKKKKAIFFQDQDVQHIMKSAHEIDQQHEEDGNHRRSGSYVGQGMPMQAKKPKTGKKQSKQSPRDKMNKSPMSKQPKKGDDKKKQKDVTVKKPKKDAKKPERQSQTTAKQRKKSPQISPRVDNRGTVAPALLQFAMPEIGSARDPQTSATPKRVLENRQQVFTEMHAPKQQNFIQTQGQAEAQRSEARGMFPTVTVQKDQSHYSNHSSQQKDAFTPGRIRASKMRLQNSNYEQNSPDTGILSNEVRLDPIDINLDNKHRSKVDTRPISRQSNGHMSRKVTNNNSIELSKGSMKFSNKVGPLTTTNAEHHKIGEPQKFYRSSKREQQEIEQVRITDKRVVSGKPSRTQLEGYAEKSPLQSRNDLVEGYRSRSKIDGPKTTISRQYVGSRGGSNEGITDQDQFMGSNCSRKSLSGQVTQSAQYRKFLPTNDVRFKAIQDEDSHCHGHDFNKQEYPSHLSRSVHHERVSKHSGRKLSNERKTSGSKGKVSITSAQQRSMSRVKFNNKERSITNDSKTSSHSPTKNLMRELTQMKGKIGDDTMVIINGQEVLSKHGIGGTIRDVGLGFGTGRHSSNRNGELPVVVYEVRKGSRLKKSEDSRSMYSHQPVLIDQACDAIFKGPSVDRRSQGVDVPSFVNNNQSVENASIGLSAIPFETAKRSAGEQVSEGRFEAMKESANVQTDRHLMETYLKRNTTTGNVQTDAVNFASTANKHSIMIQTDKLPIERDEPDPKETVLPAEPMSQHEAEEEINVMPVGEMTEVTKPVQEESVEKEDPFEQIDWSISGLYQWTQHSHTRYLLDNKIIVLQPGEERPRTPTEMKNKSLKEQNELQLNPDKLKILSEMECEYMQALLRKRSSQMLQPENLAYVYAAARSTIEVCSKQLIKIDKANNVLFNKYIEVNRKNVIKLLMRAKFLYEARKEGIIIFKNIVELEEVMMPKSALWRILQDTSDSSMSPGAKHMVTRCLEILSKVLTTITIYQTEYKLFKGEFCFRRGDYRQSLVDWGKVIGGFLKGRGENNPYLMLNGLLLDDHQDTRKQQEAYQEWYNRSVELTGKLEMPTDLVNAALIMKQKPKKESKIDAKLALLPPLRVYTPVKRRARPPQFSAVEEEADEYMDEEQRYARGHEPTVMSPRVAEGMACGPDSSMGHSPLLKQDSLTQPSCIMSPKADDSAFMSDSAGNSRSFLQASIDKKSGFTGLENQLNSCMVNSQQNPSSLQITNTQQAIYIVNNDDLKSQVTSQLNQNQLRDQASEHGLTVSRLPGADYKLQSEACDRSGFIESNQPTRIHDASHLYNIPVERDQSAASGVFLGEQGLMTVDLPKSRHQTSRGQLPNAVPHLPIKNTFVPPHNINLDSISARDLDRLSHVNSQSKLPAQLQRRISEATINWGHEQGVRQATRDGKSRRSEFTMAQEMGYHIHADGRPIEILSNGGQISYASKQNLSTNPYGQNYIMDTDQREEMDGDAQTEEDVQQLMEQVRERAASIDMSRSNVHVSFDEEEEDAQE